MKTIKLKEPQNLCIYSNRSRDRQLFHLHGFVSRLQQLCLSRIQRLTLIRTIVVSNYSYPKNSWTTFSKERSNK